MKIPKYWIFFGMFLAAWDIFWFIRYNSTINVAQAIAKAIAFLGLYLVLGYLVLTVVILILVKRRERQK